MTISHRSALVLGTFFVFASLLLHDWNLYPNLRPLGVPVLSLLRLCLLSFSVIAGWILAHKPLTRISRVLLWATWLFFLPYTVYSMTEIRHIAELCPLGPRDVYTAVCINQLWTLLPTFVYALTGTLAFVFTVIQGASRTFAHSAHKQLFLLTITLTTSAASVFGLYTRINVWDVFVEPTNILREIATLATNPLFWSNTLVFWIFSTCLLFFINRLWSEVHTVK